jgi:formate hydrogenlyase subunit 3/multisubunit Na+/H+ antiporter MnhD subunit
MRSETAPFWVGFVIGMGVVLIAVAIMSLATGRVKMSRNTYVLREEKPETFWTIVGGCFVVGIVALAIAIPHFGPGG